MAERKWTDLERRIRWYFKHCENYINIDVLDLLIEAKWNNMRDKLQFSIDPDSPKFQDIRALANKIAKLQSK